jgi:hypothetical protein
MTTPTLSSVASGVIDSYGHTARNVLAACTGGSQRLVDKVNSRWETTVQKRATPLSDKLRGDLVSAGKEVTGYYAAGIKKMAGGAETLVNTATELVSGALDFVAASAGKLDAAFDTQVLPRITPIAMPTARASLDLAEALAGRSQRLAARVIGADDADDDKIESTKPARKPASKRTRRTV